MGGKGSGRPKMSRTDTLIEIQGSLAEIQDQLEANNTPKRSANAADRTSHLRKREIRDLQASGDTLFWW